MTRAEVVTEEKLRLLRDAGCLNISIGIESGNEHLRKEILRRGMTQEQITEAFKLCKKTGIKTLVNTFGTKKAALISLPFMFLPFALVPVLIYFGFLKYYFLPLVIFTLLSLIVFFLLINERESKTLENVYAWSFMYLEYLFFALGFTILIIFGEMGTLTFLALM